MDGQFHDIGQDGVCTPKREATRTGIVSLEPGCPILFKNIFCCEERATMAHRGAPWFNSSRIDLQTLTMARRTACSLSKAFLECLRKRRDDRM